MSKSKKRSSGISKILIIAGVVVIAIFLDYFFINRGIVKPVQQNVGTAESKARDATRKAALTNYSFALETYKSQNGSYPINATCNSPQNLSLEISNPPKEPFRDSNYSTQNSSWPEFCYQSDASGTKFTLWTKLENSYSNKTSQINTTPYFSIPNGFEPNYYFMQSEE